MRVILNSEAIDQICAIKNVIQSNPAMAEHYLQNWIEKHIWLGEQEFFNIDEQLMELEGESCQRDGNAECAQEQGSHSSKTITENTDSAGSAWV